MKRDFFAFKNHANLPLAEIIDFVTTEMKPPHAKMPSSIASMLSGRIGRVLHTARQISICASNAKVMATRSGNAAMGFRPIADFIGYSAAEITRCVGLTDQATLELARLSVVEMQVGQRHARLQHALEINDKLTHHNLFLQALHTHQRELLELRKRQRVQIDAVLSLLDEITLSARAAMISVTISRTEAATSEHHLRAPLESIASSVLSATDQIQLTVRTCLNDANQLERMLRHENHDHL